MNDQAKMGMTWASSMQQARNSTVEKPQRKEWVGLTKDEVRHIVQGNTDPWCDTPETDGYGVAEMVEAKLREKNETNK